MKSAWPLDRRCYIKTPLPLGLRRSGSADLREPLPDERNRRGFAIPDGPSPMHDERRALATRGARVDLAPLLVAVGRRQAHGPRGASHASPLKNAAAMSEMSEPPDSSALDGEQTGKRVNL
jgi:hypothetical protein